MKIFVIFFALATATASFPDKGQEEVAPVSKEKPEFAGDGYRYETVRRLKFRQRRDVNELPPSQYLGPAEINQNEVAVAEPVSAVNSIFGELPASEYLSQIDAKGTNSGEATVSESVPEEQTGLAENTNKATASESLKEKTELAEDGYRYKTVRRLKFRQRRHVNTFPSSEYLAPVELKQIQPVSKEAAAELPSSEYLPSIDVKQKKSNKATASESVPEEKTELAEDGYRYKTVRRSKLRQRRHLNEFPSSEYLAPVEVNHIESFSKEAAAVLPSSDPSIDVKQTNSNGATFSESVPEEKTELAENGYRYKTIRRLKFRQRRDVNELQITNAGLTLDNAVMTIKNIY